MSSLPFVNNKVPQPSAQGVGTYTFKLHNGSTRRVLLAHVKDEERLRLTEAKSLTWRQCDQVGVDWTLGGDMSVGLPMLIDVCYINSGVWQINAPVDK